MALLSIMPHWSLLFKIQRMKFMKYGARMRKPGFFSAVSGGLEEFTLLTHRENSTAVAFCFDWDYWPYINLHLFCNIFSCIAQSLDSFYP